MTSPATKEPGTAVATTDKRRALAPEHQQVIDENRARNAVIQQIRGTIWSKEMNEGQIRALAQYCRENQLDAVRHVEVLGGRIYLTAEFYDERGADLLRSGEIVPAEPDYINADPRLDEMAKRGDEWAVEESTRRVRERIKWNVPESAKAAVVQRFIIAGNGKAVIGVNWCGAQGGKKDPVGDAEPTKTAQTRARRRAWKQIADVIPGYAAMVRPVEEAARALPVMTVDSVASRPTRPVIANGGYDALPAGEHDDKGRPIAQETVATVETNPAIEPSGQPATAEDVFGDRPSPAEAAENTADVDVDAVTGQPLSNVGGWEIPAGTLKGRQIGTLNDDELRDLHAALAEFPKKYGGTIARIEELQEERRFAAEG